LKRESSWKNSGLGESLSWGNCPTEKPPRLCRFIARMVPYENHQNVAEGRQHMSLISVVITLVVVGLVLWLINTYIPMQGTIKSILNAVVVICVVVWLLYAFGIINHSGDIHVPHVTQ
jgi:hypothetical protein